MSYALSMGSGKLVSFIQLVCYWVLIYNSWLFMFFTNIVFSNLFSKIYFFSTCEAHFKEPILDILSMFQEFKIESRQSLKNICNLKLFESTPLLKSDILKFVNNLKTFIVKNSLVLKQLFYSLLFLDEHLHKFKAQLENVVVEII